MPSITKKGVPVALVTSEVEGRGLAEPWQHSKIQAKINIYLNIYAKYVSENKNIFG